MKSPIPLNRYDDFMDDQPVPMSLHGSHTQQRDRTPEPKIVARGLYNFVAQNARYNNNSVIAVIGWEKSCVGDFRLFKLKKI